MNSEKTSLLELQSVTEMAKHIPVDCPLINGESSQEEFQEMPPRGMHDEPPIIIHNHMPAAPMLPMETPGRGFLADRGSPVAWLALLLTVAGVIYSAGVQQQRLNAQELNIAEMKKTVAIYQAYIQQTRVDCAKAAVPLTPLKDIPIPEK